MAAAAEACAELGFDGVTLEAIGRRASVTPAAIYNHFAGKDELLYAAGVYALEQLTETLTGTELGAEVVHDVAAAYLRPEMAVARRLFVELHLAGTRHPELAAHLAAWHAEWAKVFADVVRDTDDDPAATVKVLFLVLLGLCHIDELDAMDAPADALLARVDRLVGSLYPTGDV
jgi:AcrR family transcriptional regulator